MLSINKSLLFCKCVLRLDDLLLYLLNLALQNFSDRSLERDHLRVLLRQIAQVTAQGFTGSSLFRGYTACNKEYF